MRKTTAVMLSYAFRPMFLLVGVFAMLAVAAWVVSLHGWGVASVTLAWHGHEMLVGFAMAAVAGFSLTAVSVWTGRPALHGAPLLGLVLCWLLGRLAMAAPEWIPAPLVMALDMLFPVLFCFLLGREVIGGRSRRNYPLVVIAVLMAALNGLFHLGTVLGEANTPRVAVLLLLHAVLLLVTIIAGRITPSFTANWLRLQGVQRLPQSTPAVDSAAVVLTVAVGVAAGLWPVHWLSGALAFAASLAHGARLSRWRGFATTSNPLLFVLHTAYAWLPAGYFMTGCAVFGWWFTPSAALHALTMGAIGGMVLAVSTRVALGHTGRPLHAARATVVAYWIFNIAVVVRVLAPLTQHGYGPMIDLSALGWLLAFACFTWVYWPILTSPRPAS